MSIAAEDHNRRQAKHTPRTRRPRPRSAGGTDMPGTRCLMPDLMQPISAGAIPRVARSARPWANGCDPFRMAGSAPSALGRVHAASELF